MSGVAFNCLANGKIFERTPFERVFVQLWATRVPLARLITSITGFWAGRAISL